jgi:hypothetical protein
MVSLIRNVLIVLVSVQLTEADQIRLLTHDCSRIWAWCREIPSELPEVQLFVSGQGSPELLPAVIPECWFLAFLSPDILRVPTVWTLGAETAFQTHPAADMTPLLFGSELS